MNKLQPQILQHIAKYLSFRDLFSSFEPVCKATKETVNNLCRQLQQLHLVDYKFMTDADFILLMRRCCNIVVLSLDLSDYMVSCNQDLWEVNIYCPKLQAILIHGSPVFASEFGDEAVARLAGYDGSIHNIYIDTPKVNVYHIFASARIIYLVKYFHLHMTLIPTRTWCFMKYLLSNPVMVQSLSQLSLDHLVVCAFYAVCRLYGINLTFQELMEVYSRYLAPFQSIASLVRWGDLQQLWFRIEFRRNDQVMNGTMVDLYNKFFVPENCTIIQKYQKICQGNFKEER